MSSFPLHRNQARAGLSAGKAALPILLVLVLSIALFWRIGQGVMAWQHSNTTLTSSAIAVGSQGDKTEVDLAAIKNLQLFSGSALETKEREAPNVLLDARESSVDLRLEGVMLSASAQSSVAVLVYQNKQQSFHVGEALPGRSGLSLEVVAKDHVIISNAGVPEVLWLDASQERKPSPVSEVTGNKAKQDIADIRSQLISGGTASAVASLSEIMQVQPAQANGHLIGYRISPGIKLKEFVQLGFRAGDVLTEVNGLALNDMSALPKLYSLMNETTEVSFSLLRDGEPKMLNISLHTP